MTSPYNSRAADQVRSGTIGFEWLARVSGPSLAEDIELNVTGVRHIIDEEWAPHAQIELTAVAPADPTVWATIDPRKELYLEVDAGYTYSDLTKDVHPWVYLGLREVEVNQPEGTITIKAQSAEAFMLDQHTGIASGTWLESVTTLAQALSYYLPGTINDTSGALLPDEYGGEVGGDGSENALDVARTLVDAADCVMWCDQMNVWQVRPRLALESVAAATFETGEAGTITRYKSRITRDDFANKVYITKDPHEPGSYYYMSAEDTSGGYADKALVDARELADGMFTSTPYTNAPAARSLLSRARSRGRQFEFDAIAALWLRVGDTITVSADEPQERHLVRRVVTTDDGNVNITTRKPEE